MTIPPATPTATPRLSLNTATTKHWSLAEVIDGVQRHGVPSIGIWRDRIHEVGVEKAREMVQASGLRVSSVCRGGFLTGVSGEAIQYALADNRHAIDEAAALGAPAVVLVVGGLPAAPEPGAAALPDGDRDLIAARQRVVDRVADLVPYALDNGVQLALEALHPVFAADRAVLSTLGQCLDIAEQFPAEAVGAVVDTYHVWWDPQLEQQIARAGRGGRISSYQVSDWILPLDEDTLNSRGYVGDGYIDFPTISRWVAASGYSGDVEVEIFNKDIWADGGDVILPTMIDGYTRLVQPYV